MTRGLSRGRQVRERERERKNNNQIYLRFTRAPRLAVIAVGAEEAVLGHLGLEYGLDLVEGRGVPLKFHADQKQAPLFDALAEEQSP